MSKIIAAVPQRPGVAYAEFADYIVRVSPVRSLRAPTLMHFGDEAIQNLP